MNEFANRLFSSIDSDNFLPLLKSFSLFFFVLASWYAIRPVRNEFAVQVGAYDLSSLLGVVLIVMIILIPVYSWIISRLSAKNVLTVIYSFLILNLFRPPMPTIGIFIFLLIFLKSDNTILVVFFLVSVLKNAPKAT